MYSNTQSRELHISHLFKAPVTLMWQAWTNPNHIANWWGPTGFTNTIEVMNFTEGGEWKFTMHGPDGKDYANRSIFKEIIPFEKIVFEHFNPHFIATIFFKTQASETLLNWTMLFDTKEMRDIIVKVYKADEGQNKTLKSWKSIF